MIPQDRETRRKSAATSRIVKSAAMLLLPLILAAVVACDTTSTSNAPTATPAPPASSAKPYANSPEGKPLNLGGAVPDPVEATEIKPAGQLPDLLPKADNVSKTTAH